MAFRSQVWMPMAEKVKEQKNPNKPSHGYEGYKYPIVSSFARISSAHSGIGKLNIT